MDEQQKESVISALKEVDLRKADLDDSVKLTNDLKVRQTYSHQKF